MEQINTPLFAVGLLFQTERKVSVDAQRSPVLLRCLNTDTGRTVVFWDLGRVRDIIRRLWDVTVVTEQDGRRCSRVTW